MSVTELIKSRIASEFDHQVDCADQCGVHKSQINRFMNGLRDLPLSTVEKIWPKLGLELKPKEVDDLVREKGLSEVVKEALIGMNRPWLTVSMLTGVPQPTLTRFINGDHATMKLRTLDQLWPWLGIDIKVRKRAKSA